MGFGEVNVAPGIKRATSAIQLYLCKGVFIWVGGPLSALLGDQAVNEHEATAAGLLGGSLIGWLLSSAEWSADMRSLRSGGLEDRLSKRPLPQLVAHKGIVLLDDCQANIESLKRGPMLFLSRV